MDVRKGYISYTADDFILYVFSLVVFGAVSIAALQSHWQLIAIFLALAYMLIFFIVQHGAKIDWGSFVLILKEVLLYPIVFLKELRPSIWILSPVYVSYALALCAEAFFSPKLNETIWIQPFPYLTLFYIHFVLITLFRTYILFGHLKRHAYVKSFLETSTWKQQIQGIDIRLSIIHSYLTGVLVQLAMLFPALVFWHLTSPTYFRETMLIIFYLILQFIYSSIKGQTIYGTEGKKTYGTGIQVDDWIRWYYLNHDYAHHSRFYFTVFHGHHHDAIPSSLLASMGGAGLLEGMHRTLIRLQFLSSATLFLLLKSTPSVYENMRTHQYIPGLFPYTAFSIRWGGHHSLHHYKSLLPTSLGVWPFIQKDIKNGYDMANPLAQWYVEAVAKHEKIDPFIVANYTVPGKIVPPWPSIIVSLFALT